MTTAPPAPLAPPITRGYQSTGPIPSSTATRSQPTTIEDDDTDTATIAEGTGTEVEEGDPTDVVKARDGIKERAELSQPSREERPLSLGQNVWKWTKTVLKYLLDQWFVLGVGFVIVSFARSRYFVDSHSLASVWGQGMAAAFPNVARTGGVLKAEYTIKFLLVAIIFFVSGLTLPLRNLVGHIYLASDVLITDDDMRSIVPQRWRLQASHRDPRHLLLDLSHARVRREYPYSSSSYPQSMLTPQCL